MVAEPLARHPADSDTSEKVEAYLLHLVVRPSRCRRGDRKCFSSPKHPMNHACGSSQTIDDPIFARMLPTAPCVRGGDNEMNRDYPWP